jgi:hypothetical protein
LFQPFVHYGDGASLRLLRGIAVLFRDRRHIQLLNNRAAWTMAAQRRDVGHKVIACNQAHALDRHGETVNAVFMKAHERNLSKGSDNAATPLCRSPRRYTVVMQM